MLRFVDVWIVAMAGTWLLYFFIGPSVQYAGQIGLAVGVLTRWLLRRGQTRIAHWVFVLSLIATIVLAPLFVNGARTPLLCALPLAILLAAWLLGRPTMWALTALSAVVVMLYGAAESRWGWSAPLPLRSADVFAVSLATATLVTAIVAHTMLKSFVSSVQTEVELQDHLQMSETRLKALFSALQDAILLVDEQGRIDFANQYFCDLFQISETPESLTGRQAGSVIEQIRHRYAGPQSAVERIMELVRLGQPCLNEEVTMIDGRTLLRDFIPFDYGSGRLGRLWHHRDVSHLRQMQAQLEIANRQLEALSMTDGLTSLANRRSFDQALEREWARCQRQKRPLALILLDVDWFKLFNDRYGHLAGDACLRQVAAALRESVRRSTDLPARYGGEEFALISEVNSLQNAVVLAELIRQNVRARAIPHADGQEGLLTISLGVAVLTPDPELSARSLLKAADQALYRAKDGGRDRVESAPA